MNSKHQYFDRPIDAWVYEDQFASVPAELRAMPRWVVWKMVDREDSKRPTKVPFLAKPPYRKVDITASSSWTTFDSAILTYWNVEEFDGIGFALGNGIVGIDLDDCITGGELSYEARAIVRRCKTYTEISPSGRGIKLVGRSSNSQTKGSRKGKVECYPAKRFFTITGQALKAYTLNDITRQFDDLASSTKHGQARSEESYANLFKSYSSVEEVAHAIRNGVWADLFEGKHDQSKYPSRSEAELAMVGVIKRVAGPDAALIKEVLMKSELFRDKWKRPDYINRTVQAGLNGGLTHSMTDAGNARRFASRYQGRCLYCNELGSWYIWKGTHWAEDRTNHVRELATHTAQAIYDEAEYLSQAVDLESGRKRRDYANTSSNHRRLMNMISLAEPKLAAMPEEFDRDKWLLNIRNGTLDLKSMELQPHNCKDKITRLIDIGYNPDADCPRFLRFLDQILEGNTERIRLIQQWFGYCLTSVTTEQKFMILSGDGGNGKSVLVDVIRDVMGPYACESAPSLLEDAKFSRHPTEIMDLRGRRFVTTSETEKSAKLRISLIKRVTGDAKMKARGMRQDFIEFENTAKITMLTNIRPEIHEDTDGIWRRIILMNFNYTVPEDQCDPELLRSLLANEREGILAWLVAGCQDWKQNGLVIPESVRRETAQYRRDENYVFEFFDEQVIASTSSKIKTSDLLDAFNRWSDMNGYRQLSAKEFAIDVRRRYRADVDKRLKRWPHEKNPVQTWFGIKLQHS